MAVEAQVIQPFTNVSPPQDVPQTDEFRSEVLSALSVGAGTRAVYADERGLWIGSRTPAGASFYVDIEGNATIAGVFSFITDTLDDIVDGVSYARVLRTDISAGHIILSETIGTLDNIDNGATFAKATYNEVTGGNRGYNGLNTNYSIIKGFVESQLSSVSLPANGIRIDVNGIYGRKASVTTFYISNAGDAYFSGTVAASVITSPSISGGSISGVTITGSTLQTGTSGQNINITASVLQARNGTTVTATLSGGVYGGSLELGSGGPEWLAMYSYLTGIGPTISTGGGLTILAGSGLVDIQASSGVQISQSLTVGSYVNSEGSGGGGYYQFRNQSANPSTPSTDRIRMYTDGGDNLKFKRDNGQTATINLSTGAISTWA